MRGGMNQSRGCNRQICDRWDLTLECIRRYYKGEESPLSKTMDMKENKQFFDLFVDFKGYVDFFFLQDCVTDDYSSVKFWLDTPLFVSNPIPNDVDTYLKFIENELDFTQKRNNRIKEFCILHSH